MSGVVKGVNCTWICFILPLRASVCLPVCLCERVFGCKCTPEGHTLATHMSMYVTMAVIYMHCLLLYDCQLNFTVCVCWLVYFPVHRGRPSSVRAARWCHPRSCSAAAGWSSCVETACWSSTSLSQSPAAL